MAWKANFWARLHDGNFGGCAAVPEMLLQSQETTKDGPPVLGLLPAAWPTGKVSGLRARGAFEVSLEWQDSRLSKAVIRSLHGTPAKVRYADAVRDVSVGKGQTFRW